MEKEFWSALFYDWQGIVSTSGSVVLLLIALWFWDRPIPRWMTVGVAVLCFVFASRRAWMREHRARIDAETQAANLLNKPKRSAAEQADYRTAQEALGVVKDIGRVALQHLRRQGTLTFTRDRCTGPLPPGLTFQQTLWAYRHCASVGLLSKKADFGNGEETYLINPAMQKTLDDSLFAG